jgi:hypothetical protein
MASHVTDAEVAPNLWAILQRHPLFEESARYSPVSSPLAVEKCDRHLRRIRHMPSTADATPQRILNEMSRIYGMGRKWLEEGGVQSPKSKVQSAVEGLGVVMQRIERLRHMARTGVSDQMRDRALASLADFVPVSLREYIPAAGLMAFELIQGLELLELLLLDEALTQAPDLAKRYLKRVYRAVDQGLNFNSTTEQTRLKPVLAWIVQVLKEQERSDCSYVDVGCAVAGGAPGVLLASDVLRAAGQCTTIHGMDIVAPDRELAQRFAREKHVLLYASDPLHRPLPRRYDVILLANVHRHLTRPEQMSMLTNLFQSLENRGLLFVNWRFNDRLSPCVCLKKESDNLALIAEANCI